MLGSLAVFDAQLEQLFLQRDCADAVLVSLEGERLFCHRAVLALSSMALVHLSHPVNASGVTGCKWTTAVLDSVLRHVYNASLLLMKQPIVQLALLREAALKLRLPSLVDQCNTAVMDSSCEVEGFLELLTLDLARDWRDWLVWKLVQVCNGVGGVAEVHSAAIMNNGVLALKVMQMAAAKEPALERGTDLQRTQQRKTMAQLFGEPDWKDFEFRSSVQGEAAVAVHRCLFQVWLPRRMAGFAACGERAAGFATLEGREGAGFANIARILYCVDVVASTVDELLDLALASHFFLAAEQNELHKRVMNLVKDRLLLRVADAKEEAIALVSYLGPLHEVSTLLPELAECCPALVKRLAKIDGEQLRELLLSEAAAGATQLALIDLVTAVGEAGATTLAAAEKLLQQEVRLRDNALRTNKAQHQAVLQKMEADHQQDLQTKDEALLTKDEELRRKEVALRKKKGKVRSKTAALKRLEGELREKENYVRELCQEQDRFVDYRFLEFPTGRFSRVVAVRLEVRDGVKSFCSLDEGIEACVYLDESFVVISFPRSVDRRIQFQVTAFRGGVQVYWKVRIADCSRSQESICLDLEVMDRAPLFFHAFFP